MTQKTKKKFILIFITLFLISCGYRFAGSGNMPNGITTVSVSMFKNDTNQTNAGTIFTNAFVYELNKKKIKISDETVADGVFKGTIKNITIDSVSRTEATSMVKKIATTIKVLLNDKNGNEIWGKTITKYEEFDNSDDIITFENNKTEALKKLSAKIAETIYNDITSNF